MLHRLQSSSIPSTQIATCALDLRVPDDAVAAPCLNSLRQAGVTEPIARSALVMQVRERGRSSALQFNDVMPV